MSSNGRGFVRMLAVFVFFMMPVCSGAQGLDDGPWPMKGRDRQHTGQSPYAEKAYGTLKWTYPTGGYIVSSPAVGAGGTIYVGSLDDGLYALEPDGTLAWRYPTGGNVTSSPAIGADGTVYVGSSDRHLYAVKPDGTLKWRYLTGDSIYQSSPVIGEDGTVYVGSRDTHLYAVHPDGSLKWRYGTGQAISTSPAVGADGTLYVGSGDGYLYAVKPDGTLKWRYRTDGGIHYSSPAVGADGRVYVGSGDDCLYALNPDDGTLIWKYRTGGDITTAPAIGLDGTVYAGSGDSALYALNPDGTLKWKHLIGSAIYSSPAIGLDGTVYVGTGDYTFVALNPDGTAKWQYLTGGFIYSSPAIGADGALYVGSADHSLYAFHLDGRGAVLGHVKNSEGTPLPNVSVTGGGITSLTNMSGNYALGGLTPGTYTLTFTLSQGGFYTLNQSNIEVSQEQITTCDALFPVAVSGTLQDASGLPISDANVTTPHTFLEAFAPGNLESPWAVSGDAAPFVTPAGRLQFGKIADNQVSRIQMTRYIPDDYPVTFDYQISSQEGDDYLRFLIDGVEIQKWSGTTRGLYVGTINAGFHTFVWEYTKGTASSAGFDTAWLDNISIGISTQTGSGGDFSLVLAPASYELAFSKAGYETTLTADVTVVEGEVATPAVTLYEQLQYTGAEKAFIEHKTASTLILSVTGGSGLYAYAIPTGQLPPGLELNPSTGEIAGTPTDTGVYEFTFRVEDGKGQQIERTFHLEVHSASWPMKGHDIRHTGQSRYAGQAYGTLKWRYKTTGGMREASPVVGPDGTVYTGTEDDFLYALYPSGTLKWRYQTGGDIHATAAVALDGTIYVGSSDKYLHALNPDGSRRWRYQTGGAVLSSPAIGTDGTVYIGSQDGFLYAVSSGGVLQWRHQTGGAVSSSPAVAADGTVYAGSVDGYLYAIHPDGTRQWRFLTGGAIDSSPAVGSDGTVYVGSDDGSFYAVHPGGTLRWSYAAGGAIRSSPAIGADGTVYVGSDDGYLYAVHPGGTRKWSYAAGGAIRSSPAIDANGTVYAGSSDQYLHAVNPDGTHKWRYQTGGAVLSSPAIGSDGAIYLGSQDAYLYAFHISNAAQGVIAGKLVDMATNEGVAEVTISVDNGMTAQSGNIGSYDLFLDPGAYALTFSKGGYQNVTVSNVVVTSGKSVRVDKLLPTDGSLNLTRDAMAAAFEDQPYADRAWVAGGTTPYVFSVVSGALPGGMNLDEQYGYVHGTPQGAGHYTFEIGVRDQQNAYAQRTYGIAVTAPLSFASTLPTATRNLGYSQSLQIRGGKPPYELTVVSGAWPSGLDMSADGTISGTPTVTGTVTVTIRLTDAAKQTLTQNVTLSVMSAFSITSTSLPNARLTQAYTAAIDADLGTPPYTFAVTAGQLPLDLTLVTGSPSAAIAGMPTAAGTATFTVTVTDSDTPISQTASRQFTVTTYGLMDMTTLHLPNAVKNVNYDAAIAVNGGQPPYAWSLANGLLPAGIALNSATGQITGTPSWDPGMLAEFTVRVTDAGIPALPVEQTYVIHILDQPAITNDNLEGALQHSDYSAAFTGYGGLAPYAWSVSQGALPAGLALNPATGVISGKPSACGDYAFTLRMTDAGAIPFIVDKAFHLAVTCTNDYQISGMICTQWPGPCIGHPEAAGVVVQLTGAVQRQTTTDAAGIYVFEHLPIGRYTIEPRRPTYAFTPATRAVDIENADVQADFLISKLWGDIDGDSRVTLRDAIMGLRINVRFRDGSPVYPEGSRKGKVNLADILYIMQTIAGLRP